MKDHALFVIFEKALKVEIVVCRKLKVAFYGLKWTATLKASESETQALIKSCCLPQTWSKLDVK